jgi:hypothetical protein
LGVSEFLESDALGWMDGWIQRKELTMVRFESTSSIQPPIMKTVIVSKIAPDTSQLKPAVYRSHPFE